MISTWSNSNLIVFKLYSKLANKVALSAHCCKNSTKYAELTESWRLTGDDASTTQYKIVRSGQVLFV